MGIKWGKKKSKLGGHTQMISKADRMCSAKLQLICHIKPIAASIARTCKIDLS